MTPMDADAAERVRGRSLVVCRGRLALLGELRDEAVHLGVEASHPGSPVAHRDGRQVMADIACSADRLTGAGNTRQH